MCYALPVVDPAAFSVWSAPCERLILSSELLRDQPSLIVKEIVCSHDGRAGLVLLSRCVIGGEDVARTQIRKEISLLQPESCQNILGRTACLTMDQNTIILPHTDR